MQIRPLQSRDRDRSNALVIAHFDVPRVVPRGRLPEESTVSASLGQDYRDYVRRVRRRV